MFRARIASGPTATTARPGARRAALGILVGLFVVFACARALADPGSPITVTKTASANPVASGAQLTYTIVVKNTSGAALSSMVLTDQINGIGVVQAPPALPQLFLTSTQGSCTQGGPNGNLVTCNGGGLAGGATWTVTIRGQVTAGAGTTLNNTASVSGTKSAQNFTTLSNAVATLVTGGGGALPDLTINKTGPTSVAPSSPMTYTLTVNNIGTANAANIKVVDTLPAGVGFVSAAGTSLFTCSNSAGTVTCIGGAVNAGQNGTITINATSPAATGSITNTAVVDPDNTIAESNELNNTSAAVNTSVGGPPPVPLLGIKKTDGSPAPSGTWWTGAGPDPVVPGQKLVYKIQVTNNATGTNSVANDVVMSDSTQGLDAASIVASQTIVGGQLAKTDGCTVTAPQVKCTVKALNSGGTQTITISGTVQQSAGSSIFNTATVTGNVKNQGVSNTASEVTTVKPYIDLTITKSDSPDPVCARSWPTSSPNQHLPMSPALPPASGSPTALLDTPVCLGGLTYPLVIGNSGIGTATNVEVRDPLPPGLIFDSYADVDGAGFTCVLQLGNVVDCTGGTVGPESVRHLNLLFVAPPDVGTITNTATVDPNNAIFESDETNNTASQTTTVNTGIDLTVWKNDAKGDNPPGSGAPNLTDGFDPIATNGTGTYTVIVDNVGTQDATGIKLVDTLPAGTKFLSVTSDSGFTCSHDGSATGGNVTCIGGHLIGTESEFYNPAGAPPAAPGDQWATIKITFFATPFVQPAMHNIVRVDPDNTIPEVNENNNTATDDTAVTTGDASKGAFNELTIEKTQVSPANPVARNAIVTYNLKVSNTGTDPVQGVTVTDRLPAGFRFISAKDSSAGDSTAFTCGGPDGSGVLTCSGGSLSGTVTPIPGGAPTFRTIVVRVFAPDTPGTYPNLAFVDPNNAIPEGNEFNNQSEADTVVTNGGNGPYIDLTIVKTQEQLLDQDQPGGAGTPVRVAPGGPIKYVLEVKNLATGPDAGDAFNVTVRDTLPANVTFFKADDEAAGPGNFTCGQVAGQPNTIDCTGGMIPAGGSRKIDVFAVAPTNLDRIATNQADIQQLLTNTAMVDPNNTIPEGDETNNVDSVKTIVQSEINLSLTKDGPGSASQNETTTYTITVTNNKVWGNGATAMGVKIVDPLPVGLIPLNVQADPGNFVCQLEENPVNKVTCIGDLATTKMVTITISAFVTLQSGTLDNEACVDPDHTIDETDETDNCKHKVSEVSPTAPDIQINKSADKSTVTAGAKLNYTLNVSNVGTGPTDGSDVVVTDNVPSDVTVDQVVPPAGWDCSATSGNNVSCKLSAVMNAGDSASIVINTTVGSPTAPFTNEADVSGGGDTQTNNNKSTVQTQVGTASAIDLHVVSLTDNPDPVNHDQTLTYTAIVRNEGTSDSGSGAVVRVALPATGVPASSMAVAATNAFTCAANTTVDASGKTFDCIGDFGASGTATDSTTITATMTVDSSAPPPTELSTTVTADPGNAITESDETNNTLTEKTTVSGTVCGGPPCVDLLATATGTPLVPPGGTAVYTAIVQNVGTDPVPDSPTTWTIDFSFTGVGILSVTAPAGVTCTPLTTMDTQCSSVPNASDPMDLAPGALLTFTVTVTGILPANGNGLFQVTADVTDAVAEVTNSNNVAVVPTAIGP